MIWWCHLYYTGWADKNCCDDAKSNADCPKNCAYI